MGIIAGRMQKAPALFQKSLQLRLLLALTPAQDCSNARGRFAAAFLAPAGSERDRHASQQDVSKRDRRLVLYGLDCLGDDVGGMGTQWPLQSRLL